MKHIQYCNAGIGRDRQDYNTGTAGRKEAEPAQIGNLSPEMLRAAAAAAAAALGLA
jgi:hypothetical protein